MVGPAANALVGSKTTTATIITAAIIRPKRNTVIFDSLQERHSVQNGSGSPVAQRGPGDHAGAAPQRLPFCWSITKLRANRSHVQVQSVQLPVLSGLKVELGALPVVCWSKKIGGTTGQEISS